MPSKILITGGTGLVGSALSSKLKEAGHKINILTTSAMRADLNGFYYWNIGDEYIDQKAFEGVDYLIHLAGAGVAEKRWSKKRKQEIRDSRIKSTAMLVDRARHANLKGVICASAVGLYGFNTGDTELNEDAPAGEDFLAEVVRDWEREMEGFSDRVDFTTALRIGVVLSKDGGALDKMLPIFRRGFGSALGSGKQWMSWIHLDDLVEMILFSIENELNGSYNATGPNPATNSEFSKELANSLDKKIWLPNVPAFVLRLMMGEMANIALGGNRVSSKKIEEAGFKFKHPILADALEDILKNE